MIRWGNREILYQLHHFLSNSFGWERRFSKTSWGRLGKAITHSFLSKTPPLSNQLCHWLLICPPGNTILLVPRLRSPHYAVYRCPTHTGTLWLHELAKLPRSTRWLSWLECLLTSTQVLWRLWLQIPLLSTDIWALGPQKCSDLPPNWKQTVCHKWQTGFHQRLP